MSRLAFQSDNIEKGSVLENQVLMAELCSSPATDECTKHSTRDNIKSIVIEYVKKG